MEDTATMRWFITGGCGFIGRNLVSRLLDVEGERAIRVLDSLVASSREELRSVAPGMRETAPEDVGPLDKDGVELVVGDIRDGPLLERCAHGADVLVHLAANTGIQPSLDDPLADCQTNVVGTVHALQAARRAGCTSFVLASSGAPLGTQVPPIHEDMVPRPLSPYGASKLAGEAYCSAFHGSFGLRSVALRFGNVYGPLSGRKTSVVAKFIRQALEGKPMVIYGTGRQTRDYIHVKDIVRAIVAGARTDAGAEVFQIATHRETTVEEIAGKLAAILHRKAGIDPQIEYGDPLLGEVMRNSSDIRKAGRVLGWEPNIELDDGLEETVAWFLDRD